MKKLKYAIRYFGLLGLTIFSSCQDVITLNLKDTAPQIVIEGTLDNYPNTVKVTVTKSTDYFTPGQIANVDSAVVSISDDAGNVFNLSEIGPGIYFKSNLEGIPGRAYTLKVLTNGKQYVATSQMPKPVQIDSIGISRSADRFRGRQEALVCYFQDTPGVANFYGVRVYQDDTLLNKGRDIVLSSDKYYNGRQTSISVNSRRLGVDSFRIQAALKIRLYSIDKQTYDYFRTLRDITGESGFMSASTPANPPNNLNNGALGYFSAWSFDEKTIIVR